MKKIITSILSAALCLTLVPAGQVFATGVSLEGATERSAFGMDEARALVRQIASEGDSVSQDSLLVTMKDAPGELSAMAVEEAVDGASAEFVSAMSDGSSLVEMQIPEGADMKDAIYDLAVSGAVESVQPNYVYELVDAIEGDVAVDRSAAGLEPYDTSKYDVNDPYANITDYSAGTPVNEWYLDSIGAKEGWSLARCNGEVTVVVMDTGINFNHEDLKNVIDKGSAQRFYYSNAKSGRIMSEPYRTSETEPEYAHGSHVAGILAAQAGNGVGFAGVSFNARILPIKIFFDTYEGNSKKTITNDVLLIKAYEYIFDLIDDGRKDIRVINLSLGGKSVDPALKTVIERAKNEYNILTVCASGNSNTSTTIYPADFDACLSVTSVNNTDAKASFSNYGPAKDIAAPGTSIWSTYIGSSSANHMLSGTSMSAPMVSACAALLWAYDPTLKVDRVKNLITSTATPVSSSVPIGSGKLNVIGALEKLSGSAQPSTPGASNPEKPVDPSKPAAPSDVASDVVKRVTRGTDAPGTAAAVSSQVFESSDYVVIACQDGFADSMSATGLAGVLDAPILLTGQSSLSSQTADEIRRLGAKTAYIIGGNIALPERTIVAGLRNAGIVSTRRIAGDTAWDTSLECAKEITSLKKAFGSEYGNDKVIVTTSGSFQDAVSMSSFAYAYQVPILLQTSGNVLTDEAVTFMNSQYGNAKIFVPGGYFAVPRNSVENVFGSARVERLTSGSNAYDTSNYIAKYMVNRGYLDANTVTVACGAEGGKGLDALAGGALAGKSHGVLVLMNENPISEAVNTTVVDSFITQNKGAIEKVYVLGGTIAMPGSAIVRIDAALS